MSIEREEPATVAFVRLAPDGLAPVRADRSALGTLPTAAYQYCEPVCLASAFGWYVFPPISFHVQYDGSELLWTHEGAESWFPLDTAHLPGLPEVFDAAAPEDVRGYAPPFLTATSQPGVLQVWTGWLARSRPGWSVLVRPPANVARSQHYELYEGIVETDRSLQPLFANLRILTTGRPITFARERPLVQVQPLERATYDESALRAFELRELDDLGAEDWEAYRDTFVKRAKDPMMRPGRYATATRKRARTGEG